MKFLLRQVLFLGALALAALATPRARAAQAPAPAGATLYVTIAYDDPLWFERFRYGFDNGKDLVLGTLTAKAEEMARSARWTMPIIVLDEKTTPPSNEPILRLTWTNGAVAAEYLPDKDAKAYYLGIVSRTSLAYHPTPDAVLHRIFAAVNSAAKRDETVRAHIELNLFLALGLIEKHLGLKVK